MCSRRLIRVRFRWRWTRREGQLAKDIASQNDAKVDLTRYQQLWQAGVIPRQQLDSQQATVGQFDGSIQSDKAQIDNQKLQLTYCRITSPIAGRVGLRLVDAGNIVHAADANGMLVITQVQPDGGLVHSAGGQRSGKWFRK